MLVNMDASRQRTIIVSLLLLVLSFAFCFPGVLPEENEGLGSGFRILSNLLQIVVVRLVILLPGKNWIRTGSGQGIKTGSEEKLICIGMAETLYGPSTSTYDMADVHRQQACDMMQTPS